MRVGIQFLFILAGLLLIVHPEREARADAAYNPNCGATPGDNQANPFILEKVNKKVKFGVDITKQVKTKLLEKQLKKIAEKCGQDLEVISGFRNCAMNVGKGKSPKSQHLHGNASDITICKGKSKREMFCFLGQAGCGGIGCYDSFMQCDIGPKRQWGPCPGQRCPPDPDTEDSGGPEKKQPDPQAYNSQTPSENPPSSAAGSPESSSPTDRSAPGNYEQARYPTPKRIATSADSSSSSEESSRKINSPFVDGSFPKDESSITKGIQGGPPGFQGNFSEGERNFQGKPFNSNQATSAGATRGGFGASSGPGSSGALGGETGLDSSGGGQAATGSGGSASSGSNSGAYSTKEMVSSFKDKKTLGDPKLEMVGSASDAIIKNIKNEFETISGPRGPASDSNGSVEEAGDLSLFERCHATYVRCVQRGCVIVRYSK